MLNLPSRGFQLRDYADRSGPDSRPSTLGAVGDWYTIGLSLGLGLGFGVILSGLLGVNAVGTAVAARSRSSSRRCGRLCRRRGPRGGPRGCRGRARRSPLGCGRRSGCAAAWCDANGDRCLRVGGGAARLHARADPTRRVCRDRRRCQCSPFACAAGRRLATRGYGLSPNEPGAGAPDDRPRSSVPVSTWSSANSVVAAPSTNACSARWSGCLESGSSPSTSGTSPTRTGLSRSETGRRSRSPSSSRRSASCSRSRRTTAFSTWAPAPVTRRRCSRSSRREVVTIERMPELAEVAGAALVDAGYGDVEVRVGDGSVGSARPGALRRDRRGRSGAGDSARAIRAARRGRTARRSTRRPLGSTARRGRAH